MKSEDINPRQIRSEEDALDQSIALNRIVMVMLHNQKENNKRLFIALIISIILNFFTVGGFLIYESQWDRTVTEEIVTTTTTTEYDVDQNADGDSDIVNGNQYNDSATHYEGGVK